MKEKLKFFKFLERKKEENYRVQNKAPSNKTAIGKIELLREIYKYHGFSFLSVAFLREGEEKYYKSLMRALKDKKEEMELITHNLKFHYRRLRNYDVIKVGNVTYVISEK